MAPQTGIFSVPYSSSSTTTDSMGITYQHHNPIAGPSSRTHPIPIEELKKETKKRKDLSGKLGKEMHDRRDDARHFTENVSALQRTAAQLALRPESLPLYELRLLPLSIERSALLVQLEIEEKHALDCAHQAYEEERQRVEEEWRRGRDRVRERLLEGIEERRRRAREEKEGEGTAGDASMEQSRPHITRKLRNKMGTSPPPTPLGVPNALLPNGAVPTSSSGISTLPVTSGPFTNPNSLSVDDIPSPFPLPLTSTPGLSNSGAASAVVPAPGPNGGRRRTKASGTHFSQAIGGLGKSLGSLTACKDSEVENDLVEIRRANKRRRAAQGK
ncbi:hypothetical protein FB45DRAFT_904997 [Roridomyces roridus]|uniref:Centrosomal protein ATPase n=1 Tax=Roridomyces roridus TaxID=1738132 RepID=A0AAD7FVE0_9AGAR|nr:hypothetical protein FB45DRAFT_904997 [Roridomyces roridus]